LHKNLHIKQENAAPNCIEEQSLDGVAPGFDVAAEWVGKQWRRTLEIHRNAAHRTTTHEIYTMGTPTYSKGRPRQRGGLKHQLSSSRGGEKKTRAGRMVCGLGGDHG